MTIVPRVTQTLLFLPQKPLPPIARMPFSFAREANFSAVASSCSEHHASKPSIPVVYNTGGYEKVQTLKQLDGLVDIYLTDLKYYDSAVSLKYSEAADYFEKAFEALKEMKRQQPCDIYNENGIMQKGVIIRLLILPGNISQTIKLLDLIADNFSNDTVISLMSQYTPCGRAEEYPTINRRISKREYKTVKDRLLSLGFENAYIQELSSSKEEYIPPFDLTGV